MSRIKPESVSYGHPTAASGAAMVEYILRAVDLALAGEVAAVVTAPISKAAMHLGGYHYPGHTELLAQRCQDPGLRHDVGRRRFPGGIGHHPLSTPGSAGAPQSG